MSSLHRQDRAAITRLRGWMKCHKYDSRLRIYPFGGFWHVWDARHDNHTDIVKGTIAGAMNAAREYIEEAQDAEHDEADY